MPRPVDGINGLDGVYAICHGDLECGKGLGSTSPLMIHGSSAIDRLFFQTRSAVSEQTTELLQDGSCLLLAHAETIERGALQLYRSVLQFIPRRTALYSTYKDLADGRVTLVRGMDEEWTACHATLWGHTDSVLSASFSPDGGVRRHVVRRPYHTPMGCCHWRMPHDFEGSY